MDVAETAIETSKGKRLPEEKWKLSHSHCHRQKEKKNPEALLVTELINPGLEINTRAVSGSLPGSSLSLLITLGDSPGACVAHSN